MDQPAYGPPAELRRPDKKAACDTDMQVVPGKGPPGDARGTVEVTVSGKGKVKTFGVGASYLFARGERLQHDGKRCFCDCMVYRQQIRPWAFFQQPGQGWVEADRITSSRTCVPTGRWSDEDTYSMEAGLADEAKYGCKRGPYRDKPGLDTPPPGTEVLIRYNMRFLLWDACQQTVLKQEERTLDVAGVAPNLWVGWTPGLSTAPTRPPGATPIHYTDNICT